MAGTITYTAAGAINVPIIPFIEGDGIGPDIWAAAITKKTVIYELARLMDGASELKCSVFADAIIGNME